MPWEIGQALLHGSRRRLSALSVYQIYGRETVLGTSQACSSSNIVPLQVGFLYLTNIVRLDELVRYLLSTQIVVEGVYNGSAESASL